MTEEESCKTYSDEKFYGKPLPPLVSLDMAVGDIADFKTKGVVSIVYFFTTFYKGGYVVNEELTVLQEKYPEVQIIAISCDPDKEKVEKLLKKIADGSCCDPITKQVWRLKVPFIAQDANKTVAKAFSDIVNTAVLHSPQAFIIDPQGNIAWRQNLLQTFNFSNCNFEKQLQLVLSGKPVEQVHGEKPKVTVEAEDAECEDEMSLF